MIVDDWLDGKKHIPPTGVIIEGLWDAPNDHDDFPVRGWLRHDVVKCSKGEYHLIGPTHSAIAIPPDYWRLQSGVPAPKSQS